MTEATQLSYFLSSDNPRSSCKTATNNGRKFGQRLEAFNFILQFFISSTRILNTNIQCLLPRVHRLPSTEDVTSGPGFIPLLQNFPGRLDMTAGRHGNSSATLHMFRQHLTFVPELICYVSCYVLYDLHPTNSRRYFGPLLIGYAKVNREFPYECPWHLTATNSRLMGSQNPADLLVNALSYRVLYIQDEQSHSRIAQDVFHIGGAWFVLKIQATVVKSSTFKSRSTY